MHWSLYILLGGTLNAIVNLGYKSMASKESMYLFVACVMLTASLAMLALAYGANRANWAEITTGYTPYIAVAMGVGSAGIMWFITQAFAGGGPISLVDPLWACIYALVSVLIGLALLREAPSAAALAGIGLYLVGAFLMARG